MGFKLYDADGCTNYDDEAAYTFNSAGLLVVVHERIRTTYSPGAWLRVEEDALEPKPGKGHGF